MTEMFNQLYKQLLFDVHWSNKWLIDLSLQLWFDLICCFVRYFVFLHVGLNQYSQTWSSIYLCWCRRAHAAPCTPLCCRTARTSFSHRCPSAAFLACPQTASCLLRGRISPRWGEREQDHGRIMWVREKCSHGRGGCRQWRKKKKRRGEGRSAMSPYMHE